MLKGYDIVTLVVGKESKRFLKVICHYILSLVCGQVNLVLNNFLFKSNTIFYVIFSKYSFTSPLLLYCHPKYNFSICNPLRQHQLNKNKDIKINIEIFYKFTFSNQTTQIKQDIKNITIYKGQIIGPQITCIFKQEQPKI